MSLRSFLREWSELSRFRSLGRDSRSIVFYAEDRNSWVHFEAILAELTGPMGTSVCYVTSSEQDPVLKGQREGILPFYIGSGSARTSFFRGLEAGVMVMTMPDLETFHIKRSPKTSHYAYVHHSMVSTHMVYRPGAFDAFDSILCVGPHHVSETRAAEALAGLPPKELVEHGYGRLDRLMADRTEAPEPPVDVDDPRTRVLVAPSWGDEGLLESRGAELVAILIEAGFGGAVIAPTDLSRMPAVITALRDGSADYGERIERLRDRWIYNAGRSGAAAAAHIAERAQSAPHGKR
jgi:hypothetical protein